MHNGEESDNILMVSSAGYSGFDSKVFASFNPASMEITIDTSKICDGRMKEESVITGVDVLWRPKAAEEFVITDVDDLWRPWQNSWEFMPGTAVAVVREELKSETTLNELFNAD